MNIEKISSEVKLYTCSVWEKKTSVYSCIGGRGLVCTILLMYVCVFFCTVDVLGNNQPQPLCLYVKTMTA